jgi:dihydroorotase
VGELELDTVIRALTVGPACVLGMTAGFGAGAPADLVVFDPAERWTVEPITLRSKGFGNPLHGRSLPGRVLATIAGGRIAYAAAEAN